MKNCIDEYKLFEVAEDESVLRDENDLSVHLSRCEKCNKTLHEYKAIKSNVVDYYTKVEPNKNGKYQLNNNIQLHTKNYKKPLQILSLAASFILGFLLIENSFNGSPGESRKDLISEFRYIDLNDTIGEWEVEVYTISNKLEMIRDQIDQLSK